MVNHSVLAKHNKQQGDGMLGLPVENKVLFNHANTWKLVGILALLVLCSSGSWVLGARKREDWKCSIYG